MNETAKPKSVITAARTTFQWSIDKAALAQWAQDTLESMSVAYGIQKEAIDPGFCRYHYDYDKIAMLSETMVNHIIDVGVSAGRGLSGLESAEIIGHGKNAAIKITLDADKSVRENHSRRYEVLGAPEGAAAMPPRAGAKMIRQSVTRAENGFTLDGTMLLSGIKGIAEFFNQANEQFLEAYEKASPFEKTKKLEATAKMINEKLAPLGVEYEVEGSKTSAIIHIDKVMQYVEAHSGAQHGFIVRRNGDGTASMTVDYRKLVDVASEKAQTLLAKNSKNGRSSIYHDNENIDVTLSKQGMESVWNGLVNKMTEMMIEYNRTHFGSLMDNLGTVAQPKR